VIVAIETPRLPSGDLSPQRFTKPCDVRPGHPNETRQGWQQ
jgi:hypothetical protein